ncbi:MAG: DegT/DnrJ/EryC1/StrS aminotransferase family protein [Acidobacteria bacterium]|nr:DegT/DnrJ/EryC1/StrS aminotransferase family protein [Acidobacteriota bacterium]
MSRAVEELESEFARWLGVAGAVATGLGRSAAWLALEAAGVRGGEVLVPDFICAQILEAVRRAGARPVFYRVGRDLTVDLATLEGSLTPETRAAIIAHYFGRALPGIAQLAAICRARGVHLVEDCALALGASAAGRKAGTLGDTAIFSFTKSDWCYGGGMVASNRPDLLTELRAVRERNLRVMRAHLLRYGLLRRADFAANRLAHSHIAEHAGRWLERLTGTEGNFYDAGRFDAALPAFAARRARRLLATLPAATAHRQQILRQLTAGLEDAPGTLLRPQADPGDAASFLLVVCQSGRAEQWVEQAAHDGVTLRRCWPAYQDLAPGQQSSDVRWLADHLLLLELHPDLTDDEATRVARVLRVLSMGQS